MSGLIFACEKRTKMCELRIEVHLIILTSGVRIYKYPRGYVTAS